MASAVDKQPAAARLSAVAAAGCLPTATRGSQNSYTTLWDTTRDERPVHAALSDHAADGLHLWAAAGAKLQCVARRGEFVQKRPGTCNLRAQCVHPGTKPRIGGVD